MARLFFFRARIAGWCTCFSTNTACTDTQYPSNHSSLRTLCKCLMLRFFSLPASPTSSPAASSAITPPVFWHLWWHQQVEKPTGMLSVPCRVHTHAHTHNHTCMHTLLDWSERRVGSTDGGWLVMAGQHKTSILPKFLKNGDGHHGWSWPGVCSVWERAHDWQWFQDVFEENTATLKTVWHFTTIREKNLTFFFNTGVNCLK